MCISLLCLFCWNLQVIYLLYFLDSSSYLELKKENIHIWWGLYGIFVLNQCISIVISFSCSLLTPFILFKWNSAKKETQRNRTQKEIQFFRVCHGITSRHYIWGNEICFWKIRHFNGRCKYWDSLDQTVYGRSGKFQRRCAGHIF